MAEDLQIAGMAELLQAFDQFPAKLQQNALGKVMLRGGRIIQYLAQSLVPVGSGALRKSIKVTLVRDGATGDITARVVAGAKVGKDDPFYAWMVEGGTKPHEERPKGKKSLFLAGIFSEVVEHPGAKPHPFLLPALEGGADTALEAMQEEFAAQVEQLGDL